MKITGFQKESFIDYPSKISSVVFTGRCNYQCPACHAKHILENKEETSEKEVLDYLDSRKDWIEGVVLCGGEPTLEYDLIDFARKLKQKDICVKLDTNGSNPDVLFELQRERLVDYVAMDIKGSPNLYPHFVNASVNLRDIEKSIGITANFPDFEFRTTVAPYDNSLPLSISTSMATRLRLDFYFDNWMTKQDGEKMAEWVYKNISCAPDNVKWYVQKFVARSKEEMVNFWLAKENAPKEFHETPYEVLEQVKEGIKNSFPNVRIRSG